RCLLRMDLLPFGGSCGEWLFHLSSLYFLVNGRELDRTLAVGRLVDVAQCDRLSGSGVRIGAAAGGRAEVVKLFLVRLDPFAVVVAGELIIGVENHLDPVGRRDRKST